MQKVQECGFVPLIGASGSGKSSIVRAGLIPRLEDLGWRILPVAKPGTEPMQALSIALEDLYQEPNFPAMSGVKPLIPGDEKILLLIDQFEEVFTLCRDKSEQARFIKYLLEFSPYEQGRIVVVVTMRADFVEACLADEGLTQAIRSDAVWLGPITGTDLEAAIEQPAMTQGTTLQPRLLAQILQDVAAEENCLPLLEFALSELWARQSNQELTLEAYRKLGGVTGALNTHAEDVYKQLAKRKQEHWVQRVMLRLVRTGEGTKDVRQRQRKADLLDIAKDEVEKDAIESVITALVDGRLLVSNRVDDHDVIDLTHEALMVSWHRLAGWRENDREVRRIADKIEDSRQYWEGKCEKTSYLIQGGLLIEIRYHTQEKIDTYLSSPGKLFLCKSMERSKKASLTKKIVIFVAFLGVFGSTLGAFPHRSRIFLWWLNTRKENLNNMNLSGAYLRYPEANLSKANFDDSNLEKTDLAGLDLRGASLKRTKLYNAFMPDVQLEGANLSNADLTQSNLSRGNLKDAILTKTKLLKAHMPHSQLEKSNLEQADLSEANLGSANLSGAILIKTKFLKAHMPHSKLEKSNLEQADLSEANLDSANLSGAILRSTILMRTYMPKADLSGADLLDADFRGNSTITPEQVKSAKNWDQGIYDQEFCKTLKLEKCKTL